MRDEKKDDQTTEQSEPDRERLCIVGIGASAGGLEAIREMLTEARSDSNLAYVVIQHLDPNHESLLAELLARHTALNVRQVSGGEKILAGNVPSFDRVFLDPITGAVLAVDRRFVTAEQKRYLVAGDIRCRFPGCRRPATECDIDHREDWALGGKTDIDNLGALRLSHESAWVRMSRGGGAGWPRRSGGGRGAEFEEVVGAADQPPFCVDGGHSSSCEASVAEVGFDVSEDGFDAVLPFPVGL